MARNFGLGKNMLKYRLIPKDDREFVRGQTALGAYDQPD